MKRISEFPEDYQVLLFDILCHEYPTLADDHDKVLISTGKIIHHNDEFEEETYQWKQEDFDKAKEYLAAMRRGDKFPPLITHAPRQLLQDGYHRMWAYRELGVEFVDFIYISEQESLIREHIASHNDNDSRVSTMA